MKATHGNGSGAAIGAGMADCSDKLFAVSCTTSSCHHAKATRADDRVRLYAFQVECSRYVCPALGKRESSHRASRLCSLNRHRHRPGSHRLHRPPRLRHSHQDHAGVPLIQRGFLSAAFLHRKPECGFTADCRRPPTLYLPTFSSRSPNTISRSSSSD